MESRTTSTDFFWAEDTPPAAACETKAMALAMGVSISSLISLAHTVRTIHVFKMHQKQTRERQKMGEGGVTMVMWTEVRGGGTLDLQLHRPGLI